MKPIRLGMENGGHFGGASLRPSIDHILPHFANFRSLRSVCEHLGTPINRFLTVRPVAGIDAVLGRGGPIPRVRAGVALTCIIHEVGETAHDH